MARLKSGSVPGIRHHKPTGKAVVTLSGQDFYCGPWGSKTAIAEYDRQVALWLARGRRPLVQEEQAPGLTVVELLANYLRFCKTYYRKNGKVTSEVHSITSALQALKALFGRESVADFGPLKLAAVQQAMIRQGLSRSTINNHTWRVVRMFRWGVKNELVDPSIAQALREVGGLHKGRTDARETEPVVPVAEGVIQATLPHLPPIVSDMVRLQRLTGCRPAEICILRPCDVDASGVDGVVWAYRPASHKTEHHGRERIIFVGPKGQDVLRPYLLRAKEEFCFCPADGERKRRAAAHDARVVPIHHGNRPGTNKRAKPKRPAGQRYTVASYRRAIYRACELAFEMPGELRKPAADETAEQRLVRQKCASKWRAEHCWAPNQLRHSAGTEIRKRFGLEAAQVTLGHAAADVTQVYAERDLQKAAEIMALVG